MPTSFEAWMNGEDRGPLEVPNSNVALIVVDMQNVFVTDEYSMSAPDVPLDGFKAAVPGCVLLVEAARQAGHMIIFTRYAHMHDNADELSVMGRRAIQPPRPKTRTENTPHVQIIQEIVPGSGEFIIDKSRPSAFYGTRLEPLLTANRIQSLIVCGVTTNVCVESTARDAHQRGYDTYVVEDATGEFEESRHWHSLYTIAWCFGSTVKVEDVQRSWAAPAGQ